MPIVTGMLRSNPLAPARIRTVTIRLIGQQAAIDEMGFHGGHQDLNTPPFTKGSAAIRSAAHSFVSASYTINAPRLR